MDLLQKELQRKKLALAKAKQQLEDDDSGSSKKRKTFLRQGDLRRIEEEEEEEERRRQQREKFLRLKKKEEKKKKRQEEREQTREEREEGSASSTNKTKRHKPSNYDMDGTTTNQEDQISRNKIQEETTIETANVTQQLRALGLPIRYFGESSSERYARLKQALVQQTHVLQGLSEKEEFRLGKGHGIRNPFLEKDSLANDTNNPSSKPTKKAKKDEDDDNDDDTKDDPPKRIYKYFKRLLKEWEHDLAERPDSVAKTVAGRNESKTLKQCKDYIRPLFKLLKQRKLESGLQAHLLEIVEHAKQGEFVKANDSYINVAIGRAAWPIGVTMVGIHARSGRAKIESSNVAHVMNSELQRKYLTSVKRLLSYAQKKRPDVAPSKKVR